MVGGTGNCSISFNASGGTGGRDINFTDGERMVSVRAGLETLRLVAEALNNRSIIPIFSLAVPFDPAVAAHRG